MIVTHQCQKQMALQLVDVSVEVDFAVVVAVEAAVSDFGAEAVMGIASPMGRDIFPRLAAGLVSGNHQNTCCKFEKL